ncbi:MULTISPECIES: hypothetical protein [Nitrospirillum]|uniref:Uncharacterized protein n=2 Tax=Nitrospirillum TaxID=1543705 RepID=A0A248JSG8_9PROT|nr:hypothetical protein [Nitrospirillum amazonense]ASG21647.1 hypothetical protein Y958_13175 [Nitrospirillum amazonense CBAmc]MEC4595119.1 hypothetical protein [Nitrospirillum amazonense]TWB18541.1 hypothetical protein FBZ88_12411 [Nitrospirillum amazonense]TWB42196.1 hypothetical protein FBZ91_103211 [Nitrospirillum amazonense]
MANPGRAPRRIHVALLGLGAVAVLLAALFFFRPMSLLQQTEAVADFSSLQSKAPHPDLPPPPESPVPPATPAEPAPPADLRKVDDVLKTLAPANVAFNTPDRARLGQALVITAKISTRLPTNELQVLIEGPGSVAVGTLQVSSRMSATLSGGAFDVTPAGPQEQWMSDNQVTTWTWTVTPKVAGPQMLILSFDALISIDGQQAPRTLNTFARQVMVEVGWPRTATEWLEFIKTKGGDISWIWASLLVPLGGAIWALIKWLRKPPSAPPPADYS